MKLWKGQVWVNDRGRTVVIGDINNHHTYATFRGDTIKNTTAATFNPGRTRFYRYDTGWLTRYLPSAGYTLSKKYIIQQFFNENAQNIDPLT